MDVRARGNVLGSFIPIRYIVPILGSIGVSIIYGMKVNLSMAMVGMLNHTALKLKNSEHDNLTYAVANEPDRDDGPFVWTSDVQGVILSGYYWGYFISQIPGGRVAELFSAKWVMFFSVTLTAACTMLSPAMAELHYIALTSMRVMEGFGGGVMFPAMNVLLSKWSPPVERSFMAALVYSGSSLGTVISMLMTGILTAKAGWPSSFYVTSGLSIIWCLLWVVLIQDSPQKQPFISVEEKNMIVEALSGNVANRLKNENTLYVAPPFFTLWMFAISLSKTLDWLQGRGIITTTTARKFSSLCATVIASVCLLALCFIGNNPTAGVIIMSVAVTSVGGHNCGRYANHIDIAPNFAGTLFAITNTMATIPGIIVPLFVGAVTRNNQTIEAWRIVFLVTVGIYAVEIIIYLAFGSGEEQPWNNVNADKDEVEKLQLKDNEKETNVQNN